MNMTAETPKPKRILNVLIACEESQAECTAFRALGHNAFSCDIQPCKPKGHPEWHINTDVTQFLQGQTDFVTQSGSVEHVPGWDLIIAHPPCTFLCKLSSCVLYRNKDMRVQTIYGWRWVNNERWLGMKAGREFFLKCINAKAPFVAVENPIPMAIAELPRPSTYACPSWFGVKYTKKTCYWLKNLPPIMAGLEYPNPKSYVNSSRGKYRSRTFPELAQALAAQWSEFIISELEERDNHTTIKTRVTTK